MRKIAFIMAVLVLLVAVFASIGFAAEDNQSGTASAPTSTSTEKLQPGKNSVNLTDKQKKEVEDIFSKMDELRKQLIDKYQSFGVITKEQADKMKSKMDERSKMMKEKGITPGLGFGRMRGKCGHGKEGKGLEDARKRGDFKAPTKNPQPNAAQ